jgi:flavin reductase (DIM6/NTAB) family NADH-FMN oxidoreductase RutF
MRSSVSTGSEVTASTARQPRRDTRSDADPVRYIAPAWALAIPSAVGLVNETSAVIGAAWDHKRSGLLVSRLMLCGNEPPCIAIALPRGHCLATLIRDSHGFSVSIIERASKLMLRKFASQAQNSCVNETEDRGDRGFIDARADAFDSDGDAVTIDPFDAFPTRVLATGAPVLTNCIAAMDCEVMRHFDIESDHELYVGQVIAAMMFQEPTTGVNPSARQSLSEQTDRGHGRDASHPKADHTRGAAAARPGESTERDLKATPTRTGRDQAVRARAER